MLAEPGSARSISYLSADSCEHGGLSFYLFWPHTLILRMYSVDLLVTQTVWPFLELYKGRSNCFVETRQLVLLDIEVLKYFLEFVASVAHSAVRRYALQNPNASFSGPVEILLDWTSPIFDRLFIERGKVASMTRLEPARPRPTLR